MQSDPRSQQGEGIILSQNNNSEEEEEGILSENTNIQ